jgi:hypothetical protein
MGIVWFPGWIQALKPPSKKVNQLSEKYQTTARPLRKIIHGLGRAVALVFQDQRWEGTSFGNQMG